MVGLFALVWGISEGAQRRKIIQSSAGTTVYRILNPSAVASCPEGQRTACRCTLRSDVVQYIPARGPGSCVAPGVGSSAQDGRGWRCGWCRGWRRKCWCRGRIQALHLKASSELHNLICELYCIGEGDDEFCSDAQKPSCGCPNDLRRQGNGLNEPFPPGQSTNKCNEGRTDYSRPSF